MPAFTFVASASAIRYVGATPVLCDVVSPREFNIDPDDVARRITPRTRAVIGVHFCGYPAQAAALRALCDEHGLKLIEDCAQAIGALLDDDGRQVGTIGELGAFSFFSKKQLCVGEGGMVTTAAEDLADRVRLLRSHALTSSTWDRHRGHDPAYDIIDVGFNYRLDEPRAALGLSRLGRLPESLEARRATVREYRERLRGRPRGRAVLRRAGGRALIALRLPGPAGRPRAARRLPGRAESRRHPDDLVPGAAQLHRLPLVRARRRPACRHRGRRTPLRAAAQLLDEHGRSRDRRRGGPPGSLGLRRGYSGGIRRSRTDSNSSCACS